jgi:hypothetical protein
MRYNCVVLLLLLPAPDPGRPRRNRTPCLSTQLSKVRFRRPMPGTRAFVRYALACRVIPNTNVDYFSEFDLSCLASHDKLKHIGHFLVGA